MHYLVRSTLLIYLFCSIVHSQLMPSDDDTRKKIDDYMLPLPQSNIPISSHIALTGSVNEDEYIVDSGDIFLLKIDVPGPSLSIFLSTVTPDGYAFIPNEAALYIKDLTLKEAKEKIRRSLIKGNQNALIEVFLYQLHPITVTVLGAVLNEGIQQLMSNSRLFEAIQNAMRPQFEVSKPVSKVSKTTVPKNEIEQPEKSTDMQTEREKRPEDKSENSSLRRIQIVRDKQNLTYDILKFKILGDTRNNPYLMNEDVIIVSWKEKESNSINIEGAVGNPLEFEYRSGDSLGNVIKLAGNLLPNADSSKIELYRFTGENNDIKKYELDYKNDFYFPLKRDDRIYVRFKSQYHNKYHIEIVGEVKYPGKYAIQDREITLSDMIQKAGGFTDKAYLAGARVLRYKFLSEDKELERLQKITVNEMSEIEQSYIRLRSRENLRLVAVDFEKLFLKKELTEDVILRDRDLIIIPEVKNIVFISGGILYPGNITYNENWNYENYIQSAGGFNKRAKKRNIKIIKSKTGNWIDANKKVIIEEGDIIFVPEGEGVDWYQFFKDGLTFATQVATIILVIYSVK
jgi:protein involved in polysaccharide export with SLBB domain